MERGESDNKTKMDQSIPTSKKTSKTKNNSTNRKSLSDCDNTPCSDVASVYEINVHENTSAESNTNSNGTNDACVHPKLMLKVRKVGGGKEDQEKNNRSQMFMEKLKTIANPLIESYYPFLENQQIENITIEVNVMPVNPDGKESGKKGVEKKKSGENSQMNSLTNTNESVDNQEAKEKKRFKIRKKIKRKILQEILAKKDSEFKDLPWKDVLEDQFHVHHHEHHHHHHYYMDASKKDESEFSLLRPGPHSPVYWSQDKENGLTRTEVNSCNLSNLTYLKMSKEEYMKIAEKYSFFKPLKKSTSMDSLSHKKSDLVAFHNYSDTDVSKCDSEEGSVTDIISSRSALNVNRTMKKSSKTEYKKSKLGTERDLLTESVIEEKDSNCSVDKSKNVAVVNVDCVTQPESKLSLQSKPGNTSEQNEKPTSPIARKDSDAKVKRSEGGSMKTCEKYSRGTSPKRSENSGDKVRCFIARRVDSSDQLTLKSSQMLRIPGNSNNKGVLRYFYSCNRNQECKITLSFEKNRDCAAESSKSSEQKEKEEIEH